MKILCCLLAVVFAVAFAQADEPTKNSPERVVHDFYQWYVQALLQNREPLEKERAALRRSVSERLLKEIDRARKGPDGLDGDPFVDAQDFDREWSKNIIVAPAKITGSHATTTVELKGSEMGTRKLQLTLVQERGGWKVDRVKAEP